MADSTLGSKDQREMVERLAELAQSGMPLPEGLRAAADESTSSALSSQFRKLASNLESGANWEEQLGYSESDNDHKPKSGLAPHVLGVIRAGIRCGSLGDALDSLIDQDRAYRDIWREVVSTLAYPATLLILTLLLLVAALMLVVRPMKEVFTDFGTELPMATQVWIDMADTLPRALFVGCIGMIVVLGAIRIFFGRAGWMRFVSGVPIFGSLVHMAGVAQMLRLLQIMIANEMPLPDALRLASVGAADANVAQVSSWLAEGTEAGVPLSRLIDSTPRMPPSIVPVIQWGETNDSLGESLRSAYELLEGRIRMRGSMLGVLIGPLMLVFIGTAIGMLVISMFMPLVSLIQNLT